MKKIHNYIYAAATMLFAVAMTACTSNESDLKLSGDCLVKELTIDGFEASINVADNKLNVQVPEGTALDNMKVTSLTISAGAVADVKSGDHLNLTVPRAINVTNGHVKLVWTLTAQVMKASIEKFTLAGINGVIDDENRTITVYLPEGTDVTMLAPTIVPSEGATVKGDGVVADFSTPKVYTAVNGNSTRDYTVTVVLYAPSEVQALYMSRSAVADDLNPEERAAYDWMYANVPMTAYASLKDVNEHPEILNNINVIFWHCAEDYNIDGHDPFVNYVADALGITEDKEGQLNAGFFSILKEYYNNGGSFFLTRYASILPPFIGSSIDRVGGWPDTWATPNNCWQARTEDNPEICGGPWTFSIYGDNLAHPLFKNLVGGGTTTVYCTDEGYGVTNSVVCYNHAEDWSEYKDYGHWNDRVQGRILGVNDLGAGNIIAWEFPSKTNKEYGKGGIVCIGSGCYDWYSLNNFKENYHKNISILSDNAIRYLQGR